jgi:rhomboid family GlyGly-CTERM serine protease
VSEPTLESQRSPAPPAASAPLHSAGVFRSASLFAALGLGSVLLWIPALAAGRRSALILIYDRTAVLRGEVWRLVTCHLAHLSGSHLAWNLLALLALAGLFGSALRPATWWRAALASALAASLGVLWLEPGILAMSGLSALLHGLLAAGAIGAIAAGRRSGYLALALLAAKLGAEQLGGAMPWTTGLLGSAIAVKAHLYGAIGGLAAALPEWLRRRRHKE